MERVSKKVMNKALEIEKEISFKHIIDYQNRLEMSSQYKTIGSFMTNIIGFDWDKNTTWVAMANILNNTMYYDDNLGCWIDR